jgi:ABC-type bacteriocin/lantibiotic exporter with double-glycine peptidase domain
MPKVHNIGKQYFTQYIEFPVKWGWKITVRGWTQEIDEPFRTATPFIFRLPFHKALVLGKWTGKQDDEETALNNAIQGRALTDEDFKEGWTPAAYEVGEESGETLHY